MNPVFLIVLAIYGFLTILVWVINVILRLRLRAAGKPEMSDNHVTLNRMKPVFAKGILATFALALISSLTGLIQNTEPVRGGLLFVSALGALSTLYLLAFWSWPGIHKEVSVASNTQQRSGEPISRDWPYWGSSRFSKMSAADIWKTRRTIIITGLILWPITLFLTYLMLKAMGATNNEAQVFVWLGAAMIVITHFWYMQKYGLRKKQLKRTLEKK